MATLAVSNSDSLTVSLTAALQRLKSMLGRYRPGQIQIEGLRQRCGYWRSRSPGSSAAANIPFVSRHEVVEIGIGETDKSALIGYSANE